MKLSSPLRLGTVVALLAAIALPSVLAQEPGPQPKQPKKDVLSGDLWKEPKRVAKGAETMALVYAASGRLEEWGKIEGVRFDMLESWRVLTNRNTNEHKIHHRVPKLCWFTPGGDGFVRGEYVMPDGFTPTYRREVSQGNYAWAETDTEFQRIPKMAGRARVSVTSTHFLSTFPFSIHERGGELLYLKPLKVKGEEGPAKRSLYGLRLAKPVIFGEEEEIRDLTVIFDHESQRIVQLQYSYFGEDRITLDESTECFVDFEYGHELGGVTLPSAYYWFFEVDTCIKEYWIEDLRGDPVPPAALRRPWQAGTQYQTDERADYWDPPAKDEEPAPKDA